MVVGLVVGLVFVVVMRCGCGVVLFCWVVVVVVGCCCGVLLWLVLVGVVVVVVVVWCGVGCVLLGVFWLLRLWCGVALLLLLAHWFLLWECWVCFGLFGGVLVWCCVVMVLGWCGCLVFCCCGVGVVWCWCCVVWGWRNWKPRKRSQPYATLRTTPKDRVNQFGTLCVMFFCPIVARTGLPQRRGCLKAL